MQSWQQYFELSKHGSPSPLLEQTILLTANREQALDLGAGSLKDSKFLLSMGFRKVTAIDQSPEFKNYAKKIPRSSLSLIVRNFQDIKRLPAQKYDLINASYSLPFTPEPFLPNLVNQIIKSLRPGGFFCGQFFGPNDGWNKPKTRQNFTFVDKTTLLGLLSPLKIYHWQEREFDGKTIDGKAKHWHIFDIIIQRNQ